MSNRQKLLKQLIERNGCTIDELDDNSTGQLWVATYIAPDGVHKDRARLTKKEGDVRGDRNEEARIRRFARQFPATAIAIALQEQAPEIIEHQREIVHPPPGSFEPPPQSFEQFAKTINEEHETIPSMTVIPMPTNKPLNPPKPEAGKPPRTVKRMTFGENFKLIEWIREHVKDRQMNDHESIAALAAPDLGFSAPVAAVDKAMGVLGLKLKAKPKGGAAHKLKTRARHDPRVDQIIAALDVMAIEIAKLQASLGVTPGADFSALLKKTHTVQNADQRAA